MQASLTINNGKDFRGDKMELIGKGYPGGFMSIQGVNSDYVAKGGIPYLTEEIVSTQYSSPT